MMKVYLSDIHEDIRKFTIIEGSSVSVKIIPERPMDPDEIISIVSVALVTIFTNDVLVEQNVRSMVDEIKEQLRTKIKVSRRIK